MKSLLILLFIAFVSGCSSPNVKQYAGNTPEIDLFSFFQGETIGWGIVQDRNGVLTRQFVVDIDGIIDNDGKLILNEKFVWNNGEHSNKIWKISRIDKHIYVGENEDVVGIASGAAYGNVFHWQYHLNLDIDDSTFRISFDDWMFLQPDNVVINKTSLRKWGIHLGEVTIVFQRKS